MKILITPRSFANHSKEAYQILEEHGIEYFRPKEGRILTEEELKIQLKDMDGIIVGVDPLTEEVLKEAPQLKVISKYGVGTDNIDKDYCNKNNIKVTITANANADAVADYAFCLMMSVARRVLEIDKGCRQKDWSKKVSADVFGKTLGLIGMGNIGKGVAKRAGGFDMKILAYDLFPDEAFAKEHNIEYTDIDTLLQNSDFISIHLPLTEKTKNLIDAAAFQKMKKTAIIVNTARGGLIHEKDLYDALCNHDIYGAGIDVFEEEPPKESKLLELDNIVIGSHTSASTFEAVNKMSTMAAENIIENLYREA